MRLSRGLQRGMWVWLVVWWVWFIPDQPIKAIKGTSEGNVGVVSSVVGGVHPGERKGAG